MKKIIYLFLFVSLLLGINACSAETAVNGENTEINTGNTVSFTIDGGAPATRATAAGDVSTFPALDREKAVTNLYAVTFKSGMFHKAFKAVATGNNLEYKFDMELSGTFDVYLVANPDAALVNLLNTAVVTPTQMGEMIAAQSAGENNTAAGFLMTSAKTTVTTAANTTANAGTIKLVRLSARFDILNKVPELKMTKVTFKQRATTSRLVTPFDMTGLTLTGAKTYQTAEGLTDYECIAAIYGYENVNSGATVLTLEGTYNGKPITPHDIVLNDIPVKRNHLYSIIISKEGGAVTPGENQKDKLKFDIVVNDWNEGAVLEWKGNQLIDGNIPSFTVSGPNVISNTPENPTQVTVLVAAATDITILVTGISAASTLVPKSGTMPEGCSIVPGAIGDKDGKITQVFTVRLNENAGTQPRAVDFVLANAFDPAKKREFTVTQKAAETIPAFTASGINVTSNQPQNPTQVTVSVSTATDITISVTGASAPSTLAPKTGLMPAGCSIVKGEPTDNNGVFSQQFTVKFNDNPDIQLRSMDFVLANSLDITKKREFTVTQKAKDLVATEVSYTLDISPAALTFASAGESKPFTVTAKKITKTFTNGTLTNTAEEDLSAQFTATPSAPWIAVNGLNVAASANNTADTRAGTVTVKLTADPNVQKIITINQVAGTTTTVPEYSISANPVSLNFAATGESKNIGVTAKKTVKKYINGIYQAGQDAVTDTPYGATAVGAGFSASVSGANVTVNAAANGTTSPRNGNVVLQLNEDAAKTVTVSLNQAAGAETFTTEYSISASPTSLNFAATGGSQHISVTAKKTVKKYINGIYQVGQDAVSDAAYSATASGAGFSANAGGATVTVTAAANGTTSPRNGNVALKLNDDDAKTFSVSLSQAAGAETFTTEYSISASPTSLSFDVAGGTRNVTVEAWKTVTYYINGNPTGGTSRTPAAFTATVSGAGFRRGTVSGTSAAVIAEANAATTSARYGTVTVQLIDMPNKNVVVQIAQTGRPVIPLEVVADFNVSPTPKVFATNHLVSSSGEYGVGTAFSAIPEGYHLPTDDEWCKAFGSPRSSYGSNSSYAANVVRTVDETFNINGSVTYMTSSYVWEGHGWSGSIHYALRRMRWGDGDFAYRYKCVGRFDADTGPDDSRWEVTAVWLGSGSNMTLESIRSNSFWEDPSRNYVTRIIEASKGAASYISTGSEEVGIGMGSRDRFYIVKKDNNEEDYVHAYQINTADWVWRSGEWECGPSQVGTCIRGTYRGAIRPFKNN